MEKDGKRYKVQDIPKEDYLFCPDCEKKFSVLETYCALRFGRYDEIRYYKDYCNYSKDGINYFETKNIDIRVFNLFIYSIIWRISISEGFGFLGMKLPNAEEERIRLFVLNFTQIPQIELLKGIRELNEIPSHSHALIRPKKILRPPKAMMSAASYNEIFHQIHLVDYVLLYATKKNILNRLSVIDNNRLSGLVRIGIIENSDWESFNQKMIKEATHGYKDS